LASEATLVAAPKLAYVPKELSAEAIPFSKWTKSSKRTYDAAPDAATAQSLKADAKARLDEFWKLVEENGNAPQPEGPRLPSVKELSADTLTPEDYKLPKVLRESPLPQFFQDRISQLFAKQIAEWRFQRKFLKGFEQSAELFNGTAEDLRSTVAKEFLPRRLNEYRTGNRSGDADRAETVAILEQSKWYDIAALRAYTDTSPTGNEFLKAQAKVDFPTRLASKQAAELRKLKLGRQRVEVSAEADGWADFNFLNTALRDPAANPAVRQAVDANIRLAVRGLNKFEAHHGLVYRGGFYSDELLKELTHGGTFTERAFFSTTTDVHSAFGGDTLFVINSRGGGRKVESISSALINEHEATFAPGSRFKVLKIENFGQEVETGFGGKKRQRIVYMDEIPPGA
jgi:hypothetical protein